MEMPARSAAARPQNALFAHTPYDEAVRAIRALEGPRAAVPILALTANVQPEQVEACAEAGMDGHVGKPIQIGELIAAIAAALKPAVVDAVKAA